LKIEELQRVVECGIALSTERDIHALLKQVVRAGCELANAEGGSLYIREEKEATTPMAQELTPSSELTSILRFVTVQNEKVEQNIESSFLGQEILVDHNSIAGWVCSTGSTLNVPDVYDLEPSYPFRFNDQFDREYNYHTKSMLAVPLKLPSGQIIGVLALVNARDEHNKPRAFSDDSVTLLLSLAGMSAVSIHNAKLLSEVRSAYLDTVLRLAMISEFKDKDTADHLERMAEYAVILAEELDCTQEECDLLKFAAPMHDIGKVGVADGILTKPGKLNEAEWTKMKEHPNIGARILSGSPSKVLQMSHDIALSHHEKFDGSGYPNGLKGEQISIWGRIVSVADVFDALTSKRPYKEAWPVSRALELINSESGRHFDPIVVQALHRSLPKLLHTKLNYRS